MTDEDFAEIVLDVFNDSRRYADNYGDEENSTQEEQFFSRLEFVKIPKESEGSFRDYLCKTIKDLKICDASSGIYGHARDIQNINANLLLKEVTYRFGLDGSFTELTLVDPLSYTLEQQEKGLQQLTKDQKKAKKNG